MSKDKGFGGSDFDWRKQPLDLADTYPPAEHFDDSPTVRVQVPTFANQVVVDCEERDTIPAPSPYPLPYEEKRYPGVGLLIVLSVSAAFWLAMYLLFR